MARTLTLQAAQAMLDAAQHKAAEIGQPMNIAVVDEGTNLVAFVSMDGTKLIGEDISRRKAETAVLFQMTTRDLVPLVQPGAALYGIEATTQGRLVVFGGGIPIVDGGEVVGGIGVSAGSVEQDHDVAQAGADAYVATRPAGTT